MRRNVILFPAVLLLSVLNLSLISDTSVEFSGEDADRQVGPALLRGERYFMISAVAFSSYPVPANFVNNLGLLYHSGGPSSSVERFNAPVYVRNKAYITRLDLIGRDGDSDTNLTLRLWSRSNNDTIEEIAVVDSSGSAGTMTTWFSPRFSERMTGNKCYYLEIIFPSGSESDLQLNYARVVVRGY